MSDELLARLQNKIKTAEFDKFHVAPEVISEIYRRSQKDRWKGDYEKVRNFIHFS